MTKPPPSAEAIVERLRVLTSGRQPPTTFTPGLSEDELARVERDVRIRFPPDLAAMLRVAVPVTEGVRGGFPDWRSEVAPLREWVRRPFDELMWAIEHDPWPQWHAAWGQRPDNTAEAAAVALSHLAGVPRLIPVYFHRYLPETPHESGNPIFSVAGFDTVHYGSDLANYFENEFRLPLSELRLGPLKHIPLWSDLAAE